jgi:hypothetical protein
MVRTLIESTERRAENWESIRWFTYYKIVLYIIMTSVDRRPANAIDNERECKFWEYVSLLNNKISPSFFRLETVLPAVLLHSPVAVCVRHGTVFMAVACSCPCSCASFFVVGWIRGDVRNGEMLWNMARVVIGCSGLADLPPLHRWCSHWNLRNSYLLSSWYVADLLLCSPTLLPSS